jgi:hypothetical protein
MKKHPAARRESGLPDVSVFGPSGRAGYPHNATIIVSRTNKINTNRANAALVTVDSSSHSEPLFVV